MWWAQPKQWFLPEEIVSFGYATSRVVMLNEAHNGALRCVRTRLIGRRILPTAHAAAVHYLAMEALDAAVASTANVSRVAPRASRGYLAQPDLAALIQTALDLGWTLLAYEANPLDYFGFPDAHATILSETAAQFLNEHQTELFSQTYTNWREQQQATNLVQHLNALPADAKMLVWCGNSHLAKEPRQAWKPMGYHFKQISGIDPFVIDQTITVAFAPQHLLKQPQLLSMMPALRKRGGTAGFLTSEAPASMRHYACGLDACIVSLENTME